ncbi:MAG TPA: hypothetical protein VF730_01140 [Terracidiphilus sp.]
MIPDGLGMKDDNRKPIRLVLRWIFLAPILPLSFFITMMGWMGLGFGAGTLVLAHMLSFGACLVNFISTKWGAVAAALILVLAYVSVAVRDWPVMNPLVLLHSEADGILALILLLNVAAYVAPKLVGAGAVREAVAEAE